MRIVSLIVCFFAAFAAAPGFAADNPPRTLESVMAGLAGGGNVILMRHANSPADQRAPVGLTAGCELGTGRGLDAKGLFQARFIGEFLKSKHVPIGAAYTSDMCRCWDTARLVAGGMTVNAAPALKTTNIADIDVFKTRIAAELAGHPGENVLLVTHSNIVPLYSDWGDETEIPSGVVLIVDPKTWTIKDKLNLDFDLEVK